MKKVWEAPSIRLLTVAQTQSKKVKACIEDPSHSAHHKYRATDGSCS